MIFTWKPCSLRIGHCTQPKGKIREHEALQDVSRVPVRYLDQNRLEIFSNPNVACVWIGMNCTPCDSFNESPMMYVD